MSTINETERNNLLTSMKKLLEDYDYEYSDEALNKIIDTWSKNKAALINAFKKHPNYVDGKFMIVFNHEYKRELDSHKVCQFSDWLDNKVIPEFKDQVPKEIIRQREIEHCVWLPSNLFRTLIHLKDYCTGRTISEEFAMHLDTIVPAIHVHNGEKTSRVINRLCKYLGYNKHEDYNREFAKFADALSPITITQRVVLSLNPIDYLTMSFGNSWASCHTIDKTNKRNMPNNYSGCYSSGTVSYMLDGASMVLYVVDKAYNGTEYELQPKINRQMFHWGEDKLVQGRLYPQDNDSDSSAYEPYRQLVQEVMSTAFGFPNLWTLKKGSCAASEYIMSEGTHYRDYRNFRNCSLSKAKYNDNGKSFVVGHDPICIECGEEHSVAESINCCSGDDRYVCEHCGARMVEDDVRWINGLAYCPDCAGYCEYCDEAYLYSEGHHVPNFGYVCGYCYENNFIRCEDCGKLVVDSQAVYIEDKDIYVCEECAEEKYECCTKCGNWYIKGSLNENHMCKHCVEYIAKSKESDILII